MDIWVVGTSNQKELLYWNKFFKITGKIPFFMIGPFCTPHSICLNIAFGQGCFIWKYCVFSFVFLPKKWHSSPVFLKRFSFFRNFFIISTGFHIKTCRSLKRKAILKIPSTFFRGIFVLSVGFNETSKQGNSSLFSISWITLFKHLNSSEAFGKHS